MVKSLYIKIFAGIIVIGAAVVFYLLFMDDNTHTHYTMVIDGQFRFKESDPIYVDYVKTGEIIGFNEANDMKDRIYYLIQLPENIHIPDSSKLEIFPNSDSTELYINIQLLPSYDYLHSSDTLVYAGDKLGNVPVNIHVHEEVVAEEIDKDSLPVNTVEKRIEKREEVNDPEVLYKVQVLVSSKELDLNSSMFFGLKEIQVEKEEKMFKYFYRKPATFEEAVQFQEKAREAGLKDAFVVAYRDGKRISLKEARSLRN